MQASAITLTLIILALLPVAFVVFWRLFRRVESHGPLTRPDLFQLPDILAITVVFSLIMLLVVVGKVKESESPPKKATPEKALVQADPPAVLQPLDKVAGDKAAKKAPGDEELSMEERLTSGILGLLLPAMGLVVVFALRGGSIRDLFGLDRVPIIRAFGTGLGLAILAFPLTTFVKFIVVMTTGSTEEPQQLVQEFNNATKDGNWQISALIAASAVIVAPISEEIMFRGSFYPLFTRTFGRLPSAFFISVVFALMHDTYTDIPSLTVLSLCFVLAYEATGSLLVPIFMHACFNGVSVLLMMYGPQIGPP